MHGRPKKPFDFGGNLNHVTFGLGLRLGLRWSLKVTR